MEIFDGNKIIINHVKSIKLHQPKGFEIECAVYRNTPPNGFATLAYVIKGESKYIYETETLTANEGNIVYLDNYNPLKQKVTEDFLSYTINFRISGGFNKKPYVFRPDNTEKYLLKFREAVHAYMQKNPGYQLMTIGVLYQILSEIQYDFSLSGSSKAKQKIFLEAKKYIGENLSNPRLSAEATAMASKISPGYLRTIFKEFTQISTNTYIKTTRINYGAQLLNSDSFSVSEIARLCGFLSTSHFIKEFKNLLGCTPLNYRKNSLETFHSLKEGVEKTRLAREYVHERNFPEFKEENME